jgi:hypothetical protein
MGSASAGRFLAEAFILLLIAGMEMCRYDSE